MSVRATIRRASQQARNAMQALDARVAGELEGVYADAAATLRAQLGLVQGMLPMERLRGLLRQVEDVLAGLGQARDAMLESGLQEAAALGVRPYTLGGQAAAGAATQATLTSAAEMRVTADAVAFVRAFVADDGLALSERLWRLDMGAKEALTRAISRAVALGWDAQRAAAQWVADGKGLPPDVAARLRAATGPELAKHADLLVGEGGEVWKAQRVFRTEMNRAHGAAYMAGAEQMPGFAGFKFLLSPRHPKPDVCDLLAAQNVHGLGAGVYPDAATCPWPAHPNTLSFVQAVFAEEVTDADRAGRETPLQALQRLAPTVREGVLGKTKADYFDQGLLTQGGIRSTLRAVDARLTRQGKLSEPDALEVVA